MTKHQILFTKDSENQYMQDLIDSWEDQLEQYKEYASEATGDAATVFEDEMIRLQGKIEQMKDRLLELQQQLESKLEER